MSFTMLKNEKMPSKDIKKRSSKSQKNGLFSQGVNPWYWSKNGYFSKPFFLDNIRQENVFYNVEERKNAFLGYKKKKFKKSKKWTIFPRG